MESNLQYWHIPYVNLAKTTVNELAEQLTEVRPHVLLTSPESLADESVQRIIRRSKLVLNYIAIDEGQVKVNLILFYLN